MSHRSLWLICLVACALSCSASNVALRPQPACHLSASPRWVGDIFDGPFDEASDFCEQTFTMDERSFQKCSKWTALPIDIPSGWKELGDPYLSVRRYSAVDHEGRTVCILGIETRRGHYVGARAGICAPGQDTSPFSFSIDRLALVHQLAPQEPLLRIHVAQRDMVNGERALYKESVLYCGTGESGRLSCLNAFPFRVRSKADGMPGTLSALTLSLGTDGRLLVSEGEQELTPEQNAIKGHPCLHFP